MKASLAIVFCVLAGLAAAASNKQYTSKFDNVNVDEVLGNNRVLNNYLKCLMDKGACTPEGRELKRLLPDALQSDCSKCTDVQRRNSQKVINFLRANKAGEWKLLLDKYDPQGLYRAKHEGH
ncbi:ejaculatory bulb-specific protein 3 [Drosophila suzukii]|uniref:Ejaculatory bulb-specific protein 3 n=1 Tax=Drosophila suzukii TaxID=28584 RepID=A0AB39Z2R2_DROSZ|nr:ejaculatory bulb-specific protein 3 [Drosophila suzukii]XP_037716735.1 ejaculatory bulb-specific protein 3 [Drosophila subpulchrella]